MLDSEIVPPSLDSSIAPILRVADDIEPENPRVAYLCRFHAIEKAIQLDPTSSGHGVRQFKTYLLRRLQKEEEETRPQLTGSDVREIQKFYQIWYERKFIYGAQSKRKEMAKLYQTASVLYDVLRAVVPDGRVSDEVIRYAQEVERLKDVPYNILPLNTLGTPPAIMELPEIKAALNALRKVTNLPRPMIQPTSNASDRSLMPEDRSKPIQDLLDWLRLAFGFQEGNATNQREHLILLLANVYARNKPREVDGQLDNDTVDHLMDKIFKNYHSWCTFVHCGSNLKVPRKADDQQLKLLYIGLYLLIWGEASNIRFMPECICYIFHNMADDLNGMLIINVHPVNGATFQPEHQGEESFLHHVIIPIYEVMRKEAQRNKQGTATQSKWRNYDDLNEYFWSDKCFKLQWPMNREDDFFMHTEDPKYEWKSKTNFVEVRTFWHLFRSFDRLWIFFVLALQVMLIIAWSPSRSPAALFDEDVFQSVMSVFITWAFLNFLQATLNMILSCKAWGNLERSEIVRYILKFAVAAVWAVALPIGYSNSVQNPTRLVKFLSAWAGDWLKHPFYNYAVVLYVIPNVLAGILFVLAPLLRNMEHSNWWIVVCLLWWTQPKVYVGREMHMDMFPLLRYTLFWILLLVAKFAFNYYVEILPLVVPTKLIMDITVSNNEWHEVSPNAADNIAVVISIWAPMVLVYFIDAQIWYAIFSSISCVLHGAFSHLGEIQTLGMLRSRFKALPIAFRERLVPSLKKEMVKSHQDKSCEWKNIAKFSQVWNEFIKCMRMEDLISNRERDLLLVPYFSGDVSVVRWPGFLVAGKIFTALDMAKDYKGKVDAYLFKMIKYDDGYIHSTVIECYETLREILFGILEDDGDKMIIRQICHEIDASIQNHRFVTDFRMNQLPHLHAKLENLVYVLRNDEESVIKTAQVVNVLQDIVEIITRDIMVYGHKTMEACYLYKQDNQENVGKFQKLNLQLVRNGSWKEKIVRLHLLLSVRESAPNVPMNLEARRRLTFFTNSLFMNMPRAPNVRDMLPFSVLTLYYKEDVLYSSSEVDNENEDGISILLYLQNVFPDEWKNFLERINVSKDVSIAEETMDLVRHWVSYRGHTLFRTVRGMMYYRQALELQCFLDMAHDHDLRKGRQKLATVENTPSYTIAETPGVNPKEQMAFASYSEALADMKFTYVVYCQLYATLKKSSNHQERSHYQNVLKLMLMYPSLRVAYTDEREEAVNGKSEKVYYSVLVKGGEKFDEEIYRIKLPGPPIFVGAEKPENQNQAIIFTRGEALQTVDMNQDNYMEEAFKMRNVLEELLKSRRGGQKPTVLDLREHIYTGSFSSLAWFVSSLETNSLNVGKRILASPLRARFNYGHPAVFDRIFHLTRGGISKASKLINLSEYITTGFDTTLRGGYVTHPEYMQVGKGRYAGMNQISQFEAQVANANGEQTLSRDLYRLGRCLDFYRMLSLYFTTVGIYFSSMVTVLTVYVFLYGRLYLVLSGLERTILNDPIVYGSKSLETSLVTQSVIQLGLLQVLPMVMEIGLERGIYTALADFVVMQLQLVSVFFTFQLGTKAHYFGRTILHGGAKYRATGQRFLVFHATFAENYRLYSRSHFVKGLELMILLVIYRVYGHPYRTSLNLFVMFSMWFLIASWLFAPFIFNPSGFEWKKTLDDWTDWKRWMANSGGFELQPYESWESWWNAEQDHLKHTDIRGRVLEIVLACRFLTYQYGIIYHLNIASHVKSDLAYGLSWIVMLAVLLLVKAVSIKRRFAPRFQLMCRILKGVLYLHFIFFMTILFVVYGLTVSDVFASILGFIPTGWAFILVGQACRPLFKRIGWWYLVKELARVYEYMMGILIFMPLAILSWLPYVSGLQTRWLFKQVFKFK